MHFRLDDSNLRGGRACLTVLPPHWQLVQRVPIGGALAACEYCAVSSDISVYTGINPSILHYIILNNGILNSNSPSGTPSGIFRLYLTVYPLSLPNTDTL